MGHINHKYRILFLADFKSNVPCQQKLCQSGLFKYLNMLTDPEWARKEMAMVKLLTGKSKRIRWWLLSNYMDISISMYIC